MTIKNKFLFLNSLNVKELKLYSKGLGLKGYSNLKKKELIVNIKRNMSVLIIQRWYRKKKAFNDICLITRDKIRYPCWAYKLNKGLLYYNLPGLVDYMLSSGNFRDPYTNEDINTKQLASIDKYMKKVKLNRKSLVIAKKNKAFYRKKKAREETIDAIVEEIRNTVFTIKELLISDMTLFEIRYQLSTVYYTSLRYYIHLLSNSKKDYMKRYFISWINILENNQNYYCEEKQELKNKVILWLKEEEKKYI